MKRLLQTLAITLLPLGVGGCGFHLESSMPLPHSLSSVRIDASDTQSTFYYGLRNALRVAGARIDDANQDPNAAVIHILNDVTAEKVLTVSTADIPTEYELTYSVRVAVHAGDKEVMPAEEHQLMRDYIWNESQMLAKEREKARLSDAMARELVTVIMHRFSSL